MPLTATLRHLFEVYARNRLTLALGALDLRDAAGRMIGRIDRLAVRQGELLAEGWATAPRVGFADLGEDGLAAPAFPRADVAAALDLPPETRVGFVARRPGWDRGEVRFVVDTGAARYVYVTPAPPLARLRRARRALLPGFLRSLGAVLPDALRWRLRGDEAARARVRHHMTGDAPGPAPLPGAPAGGLPATLFDAAPLPPAPPDTRITIVLPVHDAFALLRQTLARVVAHTDLDWHLVAVEDASRDPAVRPWLRDWAAAQGPGRVTLLENRENLGFIRSVNRGFAVALARGDHVVLLNSDALVPPGWAGRLVAPLLADPRVASVTPMSNDAEILNTPLICARQVLEPGEAAGLDAVAAGLGGPGLLFPLPTGVGFCMAMNIRALREGPVFDTGFGRGYGEEVDWCRKRTAAGWLHLGHGGVFVEHAGGQSFGSEAKLRLVRENNARIATRYPGYDAEVQRFIAADPGRGPRLALALAFAGARVAAAGAALPVYLGHDLGGGAALWLAREIAEQVDAVGAAVELRVGGPQRWRIRLHLPGGVTEGATDDTALMSRLIGLLPRRRIVYSCGVGDPDPIALPGILRELAGGGDHRLDVLLHDFFPLSPSFTLLDADGVFRGVPMPGTADEAHRATRPDGTPVPLAQWRAAWGGLLAAADSVQVFSADSGARVLAAFPDVAPRLELRPHRPMHAVPAVAPGRGAGGRPVIGVLGNIGLQKGAGVLQAAATRLTASGAGGLVVIGEVDPAFPLPPPAQVHGRYRPDELPGLVQRYGIGGWWIPSIWPETFSFTTREALATGLPVWTFALGAQGAAVTEAVRQGAPGGVIPLTEGRADLDRALGMICRSIPGVAA